MHQQLLKRFFFFFLIGFLVAPSEMPFAFAQETVSASDTGAIQELNDKIDSKKAQMDEVHRRIEEYQKKIDQEQSKEATLQGEVELLNNRMAKTELEMEEVQENIKDVNEEISHIELQMADTERELEKQRIFLKALLQKMDVEDKSSMIDILFDEDSFSSFFDQLAYLETVNSDVRDALEQAKKTKEALLGFRTEKEGKRNTLETLSTSLEQKKDELDEEKGSKEFLIAKTQQSEAQFQTLLSDLRGEQQYINQQVAALQADLEQRLYDHDLSDSGGVLSWPVQPKKGISTKFHDPTYPFRHLFEHSGIDIPIDVGTPVGSAAPGYVAWTKQGRLYGNYVMVIHTDGIATLYAHLSKILVEPDQFVTRGEPIGLSGGKPGMTGAGLSTGPHLHFEVRKNGIPVDPMGYLE